MMAPILALYIRLALRHGRANSLAAFAALILEADFCITPCSADERVNAVWASLAGLVGAEGISLFAPRRAKASLRSINR